MDSLESHLPYILTGLIFYGFGLKWCCEYARFQMYLRPKNDQRSTKSIRFAERCEKLLTRHPIEGTLKLIATAIGLAGILTSNLSELTVVPPKVVYATIYLFFAFSGLVDVLNFYFPHNISEGLVQMVLAQSFFIEGFLFAVSVGHSPIVNVVLAIIVWTTALAVILELVWPEMKLLRASTTLLHGGWIAHMVQTSSVESMMAARIVLAFSWHIAAASAMTLCIVAITRSCAPRLIEEEPPELPIYDYRQELHQIM